MSDRWTRALLRVYPRRIRRRYGSELLDLQDQLRAEGRLSRGRLLGDALLGARLARSGRRWASGVLVIAVLATIVPVAVGSFGGHRRRASTRGGAPLSPAVVQSDPYGLASPFFVPTGVDSCFGGSSMTCAGGGCRPTPRGCKPPPELLAPGMTGRERARRVAGERLEL